MEVLGNAHITQLTADGVATGGVHVRGNGNSVTNSTFQWPTGGQVSGAFPILADAGTDYNVYRDNVVRNGSGLEISGLAAVFAQIGNSYLPGSNTEISGNTNYGDSADGAFANFPVAGYYSFGQGSPRGAFTFISPFAASPTIVARLKASQTADFFDCLSADASTTLCSIDKNGNATFNSISGPLTGTVAAANGGTGASTVPSPAQIPIGNASGTAYVPQTVGGDCTISSSGSLTCTKTNGTAFAAAATLGASGNASKAATTNVANDTSGQAACWDGSHNLTNNGCSGGGSGSGTVNSGTAGQIAYYASNGTTVSGETTIPSTAMPALAGDLSSSAGSNAVTVAKVNGVSYPSGPPANTVPVVTTSNTVTYETLPVAAGGTGATTLSANALLKGNGASSVSASALSDNGTILSASESLDLQSNALVMETANNSTTAPVLNQLVKLTGAPSTATVATTSDTTGIAGICIGNCATAGNALIAREGQAACVFDGPTTAGDWVQVSTTTAGNCHDTGSTSYPTGGGQVLGRVLSTNNSGGTYNMILHSPGIIAPATASATLTAGKLLTGNGGSAITTGNLSGDVTTSGSTATTVVQINGGSIPVSANFVGTNASGQLVSQAAALRVAATSLTAQTASIGNTTLYTPSSAGTYRVSLAMWTMTAGSSGTVSFSLSAGTGSGAESFGSSSLSLATVNSGGQVSGQWNIHVGASQAISYNTTLTCSSCGSPQYGIDVVVERLQ